MIPKKLFKRSESSYDESIDELYFSDVADEV
jgi:hypothetical protein